MTHRARHHRRRRHPHWRFSTRRDGKGFEGRIPGRDPNSSPAPSTCDSTSGNYQNRGDPW